MKKTLEFKPERLVCNLPGNRRYVIALRRDPHAIGYAISLCTFTQDDGQTVNDVSEVFCVDEFKQVWLPESNENFGEPVKWTTIDAAIRACERHNILNSVPYELSWEDVLRWRGNLGIDASKFRDCAVNSGYPYYLWNDRVYTTADGFDTGRTIDHIS